MRVAEKGQVTIPKELRDALGIGAGPEVAFEMADDATEEIMALTRQP